VPAAKPKKPDSGLQAALEHINKQYGQGAIMRLGEGVIGPVETISTGSLALNHALGVGGLPKGRVVEVYGPEGSGKTTLALHAAAQCQKDGGVVAFIDAEHALDPQYAAGVGVDTGTLLISQPSSGEEGLEIADVLMHSGDVDLIIIDSVAALVPQAEIDGTMGDTHVGLQARLMSHALRKLTAAMSPTSATIIFINQLREKIGIMFGNPETTPGGKALKFYASVRLDVRGIETLKDGTASIGRRLRVKVVKNKMAAPFKTAEFDLIFGLGISHEGELVDLGCAYGVLAKAGNSYLFGEHKLGVGRAQARTSLTTHPEVAAGVEAAILEAMVAGVPLPAPGTPEKLQGPGRGRVGVGDAQPAADTAQGFEEALKT
jgi:recombination protein RecA